MIKHFKEQLYYQEMSIRIDGLVNPALFQYRNTICAMGRTHVRNDNILKICRVFPRVAHLATIKCAPGNTLEDPIFMGIHEKFLVFVCSDAYEYHEYHSDVQSGVQRDNDYNIYQTIVYIDPVNWTIHRTLRISSPTDSRVEKNWTPIGTIVDNKSMLLYSHDEDIIVTVDHLNGNANVHYMKERDESDGLTVRGGTPIVNHPTEKNRLWCLTHTVLNIPGYNHPVCKYDIPKYISVARTYDTEFNLIKEVSHQSGCGKVIDYPRGIILGKDGRMIVALGVDDISSVFINCTCDDWNCSDRIEKAFSSINQRYTYLEDNIPRLGSFGGEGSTICLNMIVKNESAVIRRLLNSVVGLIDTYCICDTGSTDNTKEIILSYFAEHNIDGRLITIPFIDFGFNRNYALQAARDMASHLLLLDADMKLVVKPTFDKSSLTDKVYTINQGNSGFSYSNTRIVRTDIPVTCVGSTHEYYSIGDSSAGTINIKDLWIEDIGDGGCKSDKFHRDIAFLVEDVRKDPKNARAQFYLANSYRDTQQWEKAINHYNKRIELGGWEEEVWNSYYSIGKCYSSDGKFSEAINAWLDGYQSHPQRAENIYELVTAYRNKGKNELASMFYKWGKEIPKPNALLFLHTDVYDYKLDYEFTIFYYYLKNKSMYPENAVYDAFLNVISHDYMINNVVKNYKFYSRKLVDLGMSSFLSLESLNDLPSVYTESTPSCVIVDGKEIINVRYNNTFIDDDWSYKNREDREITRNVCFKVSEDIDGNELYHSVVMAEDEDNPTDNNLFAGRQDIRLFNTGEKILYTASVCKIRNSVRNILIEYGEYDLSKNELIGQCVETESTCEKNWSLFTDDCDEVKCVYKWYPLTVGRIEESTFCEEYNVNIPELRMARGSSHGIDVDTEKWFMVHMVSYESPRRYYHAIVATDKNVQKVNRMTYPSTFEANEIEYCGSIAYSDDKLHIYYSLRDGCAKKMTIQIEKLDWKVLNPKLI